MDNFWENTGWEISDRHLKSLNLMPFKRDWPFIPEKNGLYIIRGPRQIGKSCWLKSILSHYARDRKSFYLSCEELVDFKDLGILLRSIAHVSLILLDEISFVVGWERAVKNFIDSGYQGILCVTGSHAYDLEKGADLMPGRFDGGGEFHLLPMDFFEFEKARAQAGWNSGDRLSELKAFFRCGGFPTAVAAGGREGILSKKVMQTYLRWLVGDIKKLGKDPEKLTEILIQIARTMQTPISFQTLAKKTSIGSPNTVIEYIALMESSFAIRKLYAIDIDTGAKKFRSDKKFYFTDPLIYWIALDLAGDALTAKDHEEALAEMAANEFIARASRRVGYFKNSSGEVDFVEANKWCIEVKWAPAARHVSKAFHQLTVPQKLIWTQNNFFESKI